MSAAFLASATDGAGDRSNSTPSRPASNPFTPAANPAASEAVTVCVTRAVRRPSALTVSDVRAHHDPPTSTKSV